MKRILYFLSIGLMFWSCSKEDDIKLTSDFEGKFTFISSPDPELNVHELFTLDHDGLKQLTSTDTVGFYKASPSWVKNGEYIQYEEYPLCLFCGTDGKNKIIRADGSDLKSYSMPYISPDNKRGCTSTWEYLLIFNLDDNLEKLNEIGALRAYGYNKVVKWSSDSDRILYIRNIDTVNMLVNYNINTKIKTTLFEYDINVPDVTNFEWSYVGDKIAFIWLDDVYVVNADGSNVQNLSASPNKEYDIAWSPTDDILAYSQTTLDQQTENVILHDFADSTEHHLDLIDHLNHLIKYIQWSADGMNFAFSAEGEHSGIFIIDRDGTVLKRVFDQHLYSFDWYTK